MNPRALRVLGLFGAYLSIATIERVIDVVELQRIELDVLRADAQHLLDTLDAADDEPAEPTCDATDHDHTASHCAGLWCPADDDEDQAEDDAPSSCPCGTLSRCDGLCDAIDLGDVLAAHGIDVG